MGPARSFGPLKPAIGLYLCVLAFQLFPRKSWGLSFGGCCLGFWEAENSGQQLAPIVGTRFISSYSGASPLDESIYRERERDTKVIKND